MPKILESLYFGEIQPNGKATCENTHFNEKTQVLNEIEDKLNQLLDGKELKMFLNYCNIQSEVNATLAIDNFIYGFKLGAKFGFEIFEE